MTTTYRLLLLLIAQIILCVYGTQIFVQRANPFALLLISLGLSYTAAQFLKKPTDATLPTNTAKPWLTGLFGILGVLLAIGPLKKIFAKFPNPAEHSDVLPQLKGQADLFFSGQFPYAIIPVGQGAPYPVYLPLQWAPFQISNILGIDQRWPGIILLGLAIGLAGYFLNKKHSISPQKALPLSILLLLPLWGYIQWAKPDLGISSEGIVAFWYILLATGLATKNTTLITIGIIGGVLSRYSLLFWLPLLALLLWFYAPKRQSYIIWGATTVAVWGLFVLPFLMKDPSILAKMGKHYAGCDEGSWVRPDEYTFKEGLSLNIHLREWLPGTPAESLPYAHLPQFLVQFLCIAVGFAYYRRKGHQYFDVYTYALIWLSLMPMLLYLFSPMLFRYYMLMPLSVSAVLCWKAFASNIRQFD